MHWHIALTHGALERYTTDDRDATWAACAGPVRLGSWEAEGGALSAELRPDDARSRYLAMARDMMRLWAEHPELETRAAFFTWLNVPEPLWNEALAGPHRGGSERAIAEVHGVLCTALGQPSPATELGPS